MSGVQKSKGVIEIRETLMHFCLRATGCGEMSWRRKWNRLSNPRIWLSHSPSWSEKRKPEVGEDATISLPPQSAIGRRPVASDVALLAAGRLFRSRIQVIAS